MAKFIFISPTVPFNTEVLSKTGSLGRLLNSFSPSEGKVGTELKADVKAMMENPDPKQFMKDAGNKSEQKRGKERYDKFMSKREELAWKLSLSPLESTRRWAEKFLVHNYAKPTYFGDSEETELYLPWNMESESFTFTRERAVLAGRVLPLTTELAHFLMHYKDEEVGKLLVKHLVCKAECALPSPLPEGLRRLLIHLVSYHYPNTKNLIAGEDNLCWRVFDYLIVPGLPPFSKTAIMKVNWELYQKYSEAVHRESTALLLKRFQRAWPEMNDYIESNDIML